MVALPTAAVYPAPTVHVTSFPRATRLVGGTLAQKRRLRFRVARSFFHRKQPHHKLAPDLSRFRACSFSTLPRMLESSHFSSLLRIPFTPLAQKMLWGKVGLEKGNVGERLSGAFSTNPPRQGRFLTRRARGERKTGSGWTLDFESLIRVGGTQVLGG